MSVVTIEATGTEPVTEDRSATYIVRRTGSLSRALTVDLDHLLDDNLDNADPAEYSGELPYVHSFRIPRTVTFQSGQDSVRLEIPLNNDAEIEVADGSLTMIVAESADYLVGRPDAATRILQDDNDVPIRVSSARSLGTTVEGPRRLETSLTLQSTRPRDKPPDAVGSVHLHEEPDGGSAHLGGALAFRCPDGRLRRPRQANQARAHGLV